GGFNQAAQNLVLEFGRVHDIPLRVAASGTAVNVVAAAGPFLGGILVALWSYPALFGVTVALQLAALVIVIAWTPEPRLAKEKSG
ncbi:MAG: MFS transporter, partial [Gammaproteobacteria bacterium]|nr:MFS transporter [Gammaproteobacteria bacterium]